MLKSILNPSQSVAIGVGIGVVDLFIFDKHLPAIADVRTAEPQDTDIDAARRSATLQCIAVNGLVSLMTRDWDVFLIGGAITAAMSWTFAHANTVHPATGTTQAPGEMSLTPDDMNAQYPLADYSDADQNAA
jgi:hypothetical protein